MSILIKDMKMPTSCYDCNCFIRDSDGSDYCCLLMLDIEDNDKRDDDCPLVPVPEHGRLIDADALIADLKRQCKEVFRVNAVSPDDFWITRNEAYNERLWGTWCESFYGYLQTRPTVIPTKESKPRWIPVTERLPEEGAAVNITWVNHSPVIYYQHIKDKPQTATGVYYRGKWYWWSAVVQDYLAEYGKWEPDEMDAAIEVTHWMLLPEPPKGDE